MLCSSPSATAFEGLKASTGGEVDSKTCTATIVDQLEARFDSRPRSLVTVHVIVRAHPVAAAAAQSC